MGRILTSGFELNSLTVGMEFDAVETPGISIQGVTKRSGNYALKCLPASNAGYVGYTHTAVAAGRTYHYKGCLLVHTSPSAGTYIMGDRIVGASYVWTVVLSTGNQLVLFDSASNVIATSSALTADVWHTVEVSYTYNGIILALYLDDSLVGSGAGAGSSMATDGFYVGSDLSGAVNPASGEWYFDDLAINDDQGSYQNSRPGEEKVICLRPSAAGDSAQWLRAGADSGANWSQCNDIPPDDATAYVRTTTLNNLDMYNFDSPGLAAGDTINVVEVGCRYNRSAATSPTFKLRLIKTGSGTELLSAAILPNATAWKTNANAAPRTSPIISYLDPDGAAWTNTTIDSLQAGMVMTVNQTPYVHVSDIWVLVSYTPATTISISTPVDTGRGAQVETVSISAQVALAPSITQSVAAIEDRTIEIYTPVVDLNITNIIEIIHCVEDFLSSISAQPTLAPSQTDTVRITEVIAESVSTQNALALQPTDIIKATEVINESVSTQPILEPQLTDTVRAIEVVAGSVSAQSILVPQPVDIVRITEVVEDSISTQPTLSTEYNQIIAITEDRDLSVSSQPIITTESIQTVAITEERTITVGEEAVVDLDIFAATENVAANDMPLVEILAQLAVELAAIDSVAYIEDATALISIQSLIQPEINENISIIELIAAQIGSEAEALRAFYQIPDCKYINAIKHKLKLQIKIP